MSGAAIKKDQTGFEASVNLGRCASNVKYGGRPGDEKEHRWNVILRRLVAPSPFPTTCRQIVFSVPVPFLIDWRTMVSVLTSSRPYYSGEPTIVSQDIDGGFYKWLQFYNLQKYSWFFNGLSYAQIQELDKTNIKKFIIKVNKRNISPSVQKKLCAMAKVLRNRPNTILYLMTALDEDISHKQLLEHLVMMRRLLECPIPNIHVVKGFQLQDDMVVIMRKFVQELLKQLSMTDILIAQTYLGAAVNKFMECSMLITTNQMFLRNHVENVIMGIESLIFRVKTMRKNFY